MWTGYNRPSVIAVPSIVGAGASFVTPNPEQSLINGRPADATRIQWLSGSQTTASVVQIQVTWSSGGFVPGLFGLVGLNALGLASSAGFKIAFAGKRAGDSGFPYALGGNCAAQRTIQRGDGSVAALCVPDAGLTPIIGVQLSIYNDQAGVATLAAGQNVDLGELWLSPAFDINIDADWKLSYQDTGSSAAAPRRSINNQPWPVMYPPARVLTCKRSILTFDEAFIDGSTPSYQSLRTLIGNGQPSIQIPRNLDTSGALDVDSLHATGVFGVSSFSEMTRAHGDYFSVNWTHQEVPALLA